MSEHQNISLRLTLTFGIEQNGHSKVFERLKGGIKGPENFLFRFKLTALGNATGSLRINYGEHGKKHATVGKTRNVKSPPSNGYVNTSW